MALFDMSSVSKSKLALQYRGDSATPCNFLLTVVRLIDTIPATFLRALRVLLPSSLHITLLRLALWLPGLHQQSPPLAAEIARYVAEPCRIIPFVPCLPRSHGSLASSIGIRKLSVNQATHLAFSSTTSHSVPQYISISSLFQAESSVSSVLSNNDPPSRFSTPSIASPPPHPPLLCSSAGFPSTSPRLAIPPHPFHRKTNTSDISCKSGRHAMYSLPTPPEDYDGPGSVPRWFSKQKLLLADHPPARDICVETSACEAATEDAVISARNTNLSFRDTSQGSNYSAEQEPLHGKANGVWLRRKKNAQPRHVEWKVDLPAEMESTGLVSRASRLAESISQSSSTSLSYVSSNCGLETPESLITHCPSSTCAENALPVRCLQMRDVDCQCSISERLCYSGLTFIISGEIGEGAFGRVVSALLVGTGQWYAIKITCKSKQYGLPGGQLALLRERDVMIQAERRNSLFLNKLLYSWDDRSHVYFVMVSRAHPTHTWSLRLM